MNRLEPFGEQALRPRCEAEREPRAAGHDGRIDDTPFTPEIAVLGNRLRQREHDRHGGTATRLRQREESAPIRSREVRRVHDRQARPSQAVAGGTMEQVEGGRRRALVGRIVGDHRTERIRGEDLGRAEVARGERGFAAPRSADQHDERVTGHDQDGRPTRSAGR